MRRVVLILLNRQSFLWLAWGREGKKDEKGMKQVMSIKQNLAIMWHPSFLSKLMDHSDVCVAELEIRHRPSYFQLAPGSTAPWWKVHTWSYIIASFILIRLAGYSLRWLPCTFRSGSPAQSTVHRLWGKTQAFLLTIGSEASGNCPCGSLKLKATS